MAIEVSNMNQRSPEGDNRLPRTNASVPVTATPVATMPVVRETVPAAVSVVRPLDVLERRRRTIAKTNQVVWYITGIIEVLIGLRIGLLALGANPASDFTQIVLGLTGPFVWPFQGLFPSPAASGFEFELSSLAALLVYFLLAIALTKLTWIIYGEPKEIE
ncbi:MAG: YggT family protein [Chloroflexi bacterium]|nr:YggT family protein [Chloroflexota bacterium]